MLTVVQASLISVKADINNTMKKRFKNEEGFSLLELAMALGIMGIMTMIVGLTAIPTAMGTANKASMRSDLYSVTTELQGWHLENPNTDPSAFEWEQMKMRVLEDKVDTDLPYIQSITYVRLDDYYCVEISKAIQNDPYTIHFYGLTGKDLPGQCPLQPGKENF